MQFEGDSSLSGNPSKSLYGEKIVFFPRKLSFLFIFPFYLLIFLETDLLVNVGATGKTHHVLGKKQHLAGDLVEV